MATTNDKEMFPPNNAYNAALPIWQKCRDTSAGEDALHARDQETAGTYLRPLNPANTSAANQAKNEAYILMARYQNFVGSTKSGFLGMAYRKAPVVPNLPDRMKYLIENVDGTGLSLEQQSRSTLSEVIEVGRSGLLCDMPANNGGTVKNEQDGMRPSIVPYCAESIVDWFPLTPSASDPLQYVILKESATEKVDGEFEHESITVYRVLHMIDGNYHQTVYKSDSKGIFASGDAGVETQIYAANNAPMKSIPFSFVGSINNSPSIDKPIILDIANASLGMYQEDANLRVSSFGFSAGTMTIADDRYQQGLRNKDDPSKPQAVAMGDGMALVMGSGGKAEIISPPDNPLAAKIKDTDQKNLAELGAQVVMISGGPTVIVEVESRNSVNASKLTVAVVNVSAAYNQQLMWCAEFLGVTIPETEKFKVNTDFFSAEYSPEQVTALIAQFQGQLISKAEAQKSLQKAGNISAETDLKKMNDEIVQQSTGNVSFDDGGE